PDAPGSRIAPGTDRESGGLAERVERGAGGQLCAVLLLPVPATRTGVASRAEGRRSSCRRSSCSGSRPPGGGSPAGPRPCPALATPRPVRLLGIPAPRCSAADGSQSGTRKAGSAMPIDPTDLAKSIGALGPLDPERGLALTLQQIADAAKQLLSAEGAGPGRSD